MRTYCMANLGDSPPNRHHHPLLVPTISPTSSRGPCGLLRFAPAFTLLEVMIAIAFIGFAMFALLSLHHSGMQSVARARELTQAMMLAQGLMTDAEQARFPEPGQLNGDFRKIYKAAYPNFRWQRNVEQSHQFPDVRQVRIIVFYGPRFRRTFVLTEFVHNPMPQFNAPGGTSGQNNGAPGKRNPAASGGGD